MKNHWVWVVACATGAFAIIGCAANGKSQEEVDPVNGAPSVRSQAAPATTGSIPIQVARVLGAMDALGKNSQVGYDAALNELRASPDPIGTLATVFGQMQSNALGARWKIVQIAGQINSAESVSFLEKIAVEPATFEPQTATSEGGDTGFRLRYTASVGVVQELAAGIPGANAAVEHILLDADPDIAQLAGVELFSIGRLSDAWRAILSKRGISNNFKQLSDAELSTLRTVHPEANAHQGADIRARPRMTSVPALSEDE